MKEKDEDKYSEFSNVENIHNKLVREEFPDGPLGSPINAKKPITGKSTPWEEGQQSQSPFSYAYKEIHEGLPRQTPGAHPVDDDVSENDSELE